MAIVGQVPKGHSAISFDKSDYTQIGFQADPGVIAADATFTIRCAAHWVGGPNFRTAEIMITKANPHPVWAFRSSSDGRVDGICFSRSDTSDYLVGFNIA
jgi:hypothetical protein